MNQGQFNKACIEAGGASDTQAPVVFQDTATGQIYQIDSVEYQPQSSDDGGNPTSLGGTTFIRGTAY